MSGEQRSIDDFYLGRLADEPVRLSAKERRANAQERIAKALERIADALEKQQMIYAPYTVPVPTPPQNPWVPWNPYVTWQTSDNTAVAHE